MTTGLNTVESLWTIKDLSAYLKKSTAWIYRELSDPAEPERPIPAMRLPGGGWRFDPAAIRAWLENQSVSHPTDR